MTSLFGSPASGEIEGKNNEVIREICYTHSTMRLFKTFTPELHLTKLQQVEYQHNGNRLFPNYCTRQKVSFIFLKDNILPLSGIRVEKDFKFDRVFGWI
jgi:hypothetical protein